MNTTPESNSPSRQNDSRKSRGPLVIIIASALLLLFSILALVGYFFLLPEGKAASQPLVLIHSPSHGGEAVIGELSQVHATARDASGITRMEFWINDQLVEVESTNLDDGLTPFPMLVSWMPESPGEYLLTVRAFNSHGARSHSSISVQAVVGLDRDLDGVADADDACPDEPGGGEDGCPLPGDADGDGVSDADDLCPTEPGLADVDGCPDRDGDGIPDGEDADPDEAGPADLDGAADSDGDSIPDLEDLDPDEAGDPESGGVDSEAGDRDGDGAPDDFDPCPDEAGRPEDGFCPVPEDDEGEEEDDDEPDFDGVFEAERLIGLEVEAYGFEVDREYQYVWCYVNLAGQPTDRYEFDPEGENSWDIQEVLGGENSVTLAMGESGELSVFLFCQAIDLEGRVHDLGVYEAAHPVEEWDGRELFGTGFGPEGEHFVAEYRICSPTCDETAIQPPILDPITLGPRGEGPYQVRWRWDGDEDWLLNFVMMVNGNIVDSIAVADPEQRSLDLEDFVPECGEKLEFTLHAIGVGPEGGPTQWSAPSNTRTWDGDTCPRTVAVSFLNLDASGRSASAGPLYGTFFANDQTLIAEYRDGPPSFDARDDTEWHLHGGHVLDIPTMFAEIEEEAWSCVGLGAGCTSNYAPSTSAIEVELDSNQALTFGAGIWTDDGRIFDGSYSIPAGEIVPGPYTAHDNGITLTVLVDVLVGPEAGGEDNLPDLVVTGVSRDQDSGQIGIHLFNNAADLINEDVVITLVQMSTNEELLTHTWQDVTLPSGREVVLMSADVVLDSPYDLRVLVDPVDASGGGGIEETNELNNIYETPVLMRVHINGFRVSQPCESFLDLTQSAEFRFRVWVSHRSPEGVVSEVQMRDHPWTGELDYYWGEDEGNEHIGEWDLHENDSFRFDIEMPADHTLLVHADGNEIDPGGEGVNDFAGRIIQSYGPGDNYGHSDGEYSAASEDWHTCHDGSPVGWDTNNFRMWWTITRIH